MKIWKMGIAALAVATLAAAAPSFAKGHDSNTFHKIGKAIQYPINKAAQNTGRGPPTAPPATSRSCTAATATRRTGPSSRPAATSTASTASATTAITVITRVSSRQQRGASSPPAFFVNFLFQIP